MRSLRWRRSGKTSSKASSRQWRQKQRSDGNGRLPAEFTAELDERLAIGQRRLELNVQQEFTQLAV
jgi:hypothetical protein